MNWKSSPANAADQLSQRMDEVRERLIEVPEVSGIGIGRSSEERSHRLVIQVFITVRSPSTELEKRLQQILGSTPYEVVCLTIPDAN